MRLDTFDAIGWKDIDLASIGSGRVIMPFLSDRQLKVWEKVKHLQDHRNDRGHAEVVTLFALKLSELAGLSTDDKDEVVHEAILHDIGWSQIPNIASVFRELNTKLALATGAELEDVKRENIRLRALHQLHSVKLAKDFLGHHSRYKEILAVIGDHDTRCQLNLISGPHLYMLDADMLWRVTVIGYRAALSQDKSLSLEAAPQEIGRWLRIGNHFFLTKIGLEIGHAEAKQAIESLGKY